MPSSFKKVVYFSASTSVAQLKCEMFCMEGFDASDRSPYTHKAYLPYVCLKPTVHILIPEIS
jgi:hypothetical protein